jgi:hypothetical protein
MAAPNVVPIDGKQSLYEIVDYLEALLVSIDMIEDEALRAEAEREIDLYLQAEVKKVDRITSYLAHLEAQQAMAAAEIKRLQDRKRAAERAQERVEASVMRVMVLWGMPKMEGRTSTLQLKSCPASVEVINQALVPQEFIRTTISESVDKTAAKAALKCGEVPGLKLITDRQSVIRK